MIFNFLKYLQPTHYFSIPRKGGDTVFPIPNFLPEGVLDKLVKDSSYIEEVSAEYDLSWQAIQKGYIGDTETYSSFRQLPVEDEYRFLRKYFHPVWSLYVLIIRLLGFKNPFRECKGYWKNRKLKRLHPYKQPLCYDSYATFSSSLIQEKPLVSVVIPTLNRYGYLKEVLHDFEKQSYVHFEILVVDQSQPFQEKFYDDFGLNIQVFRQEEPALWLARNTAVEKAKGPIIMLSEDDVRIENNWIENHLKCLDYFNASISAGVFYPEGSRIPEDRSFFARASQFATGNAALYKSVFRQIGLFDRQFEKQRMGDGEFGLRAYLAGIKSVSTPHASCVDVKASTGGLRQMGSWDAFRPSNWFAPRPIPSVLYLFRRYFGTKRALWSLLKTVPPSVMPYRFKKNRKILILGIFITLLLLPIVGIQVILSWRLASKKLKEGPLIREIK
ncbi:MAG TPA: glycosyltransferase [Flavobacteriaceae bacterium]|nr:glycosyltransferase [Flavobacteriaceae bacterium]HPF12431.1 glycosyltransferase [Flavobacteriaceae bacterium]HQU21614.1 glycosyltransferase [Flavobacteriaceae bacterium]HQU66135.1 glycosyltransferase [Flavobacteriaceae bacterium]